VGQDGVVGIATGYGQDSPEIESRLGARFSSPIETGPGVHPASYTMGTAYLFRGIAAEVKERVDL
jgi:hypothetical protein